MTTEAIVSEYWMLILCPQVFVPKRVTLVGFCHDKDQWKNETREEMQRSLVSVEVVGIITKCYSTDVAWLVGYVLQERAAYECYSYGNDYH